MPRRRAPKRGRPQVFTRPPSERDWRGFRLVKLALRVNPASDEATRVITRAIRHIRHRAVLTKDSDVFWQLKQAREALKEKLYRMKLGLNPKRKRSARSTDPMLALFGSAHRRGPELRHYREKFEQAQRNYMRFLHTDAQKARKWARISAKLSKRIGKVRGRSNPHHAIDAYNRARDRDAEAELRTPSGEKRRQKRNRAVLARLRSRRRNPADTAFDHMLPFWARGAGSSSSKAKYAKQQALERIRAAVAEGLHVEVWDQSGDVDKRLGTIHGRSGAEKLLVVFSPIDHPGKAVIFEFYVNRQSNPRGRRNPKRDGTPTRGELRKVKYVQHLKKIAETGQSARAQIEALTGSIPKASAGIFAPLGKRVLARAESGPSHHDVSIPEQAPPVVAAAPAHPEARNILSRISDIDLLLKDFKSQLHELGDSEDNEPEVQVIHGEIEKFARQKKALREKLEGLSVATNPRRRRVRRMSPSRNRLITRRARAASVALRRVHTHLRRALQAIRHRRH